MGYWPDVPVLSPDDPVAFAAHYGPGIGYDVEFDGSGTSLPSGWSWVNQGAATYEERLGAGVISLPVSANNMRGIMRALPSESTWTAYAKVSGLFPNNGTNAAVTFAMRESATDEIAMLRHTSVTASTLGTVRYNTTGMSGGANISTSYSTAYTGRDYFRIKRNSATSYDFAWSTDGLTWAVIDAARDLSGFFTPDQIGILSNVDVSLDTKVAVHWFRVR